MKKSIGIIIILSLLAVAIRPGFSQNSSRAGTIEDKQIMQIREMLNTTTFSNSLWWYGWTGIYTATAGASFTIAATTDNEVTKITQNVSGVESALGLAGLLLSPMPPIYAVKTLDRMPSGTSGERGTKLSASEEYLRSTSEIQEFGTSWITHALNFTVNAAGGLVIWKGYGNEIEREGGDPLKEGLINFITGLLIGEIQIFTQPTGGIRQWRDYKERYSAYDDRRQNNVRLFTAHTGETVLLGLTLEY